MGWSGWVNVIGAACFQCLMVFLPLGLVRSSENSFLSSDWVDRRWWKNAMPIRDPVSFTLSGLSRVRQLIAGGKSLLFYLTSTPTSTFNATKCHQFLLEILGVSRCESGCFSALLAAGLGFSSLSVRLDPTCSLDSSPKHCFYSPFSCL